MALSDLRKAMAEAADSLKQSAKEIKLDEVLDSAKEVLHKEVQVVKEVDYKGIASDLKSTVEEKVKNIDLEEVKETIKSVNPSSIKQSISELVTKKEEEEPSTDQVALVESLRILFILITIDQNIDALELATFDEIYSETGLPQQVYDSIKFEGKQILSKEFEEINDYVIKLLTTPKAGEHKVSKEWLLWKLLCIAYVDQEYALSERKLIYTVCETLNVDDAILVDMEDTIKHMVKGELNDSYRAKIEQWNEG